MPKAGRPAPTLVLGSPDRARKDELYDLISKVFSGGRGYFGFRDHLTSGGYLEGSRYDWSASKVGLMDGRIVTHVGVWDYQMRIGTARVRSGGLGVVATHGDFRRGGLMARTMEATVESMCQCGYDVSVLFGINDFYHRFGYTRAWNNQTWTLGCRDLPTAPTGRLVAFKPERRQDLEVLYNRHYARVTGTAVRPTYPYRAAGPNDRGWLWRDGAGKPAGYVVLQSWPDKPELAEHVGSADQVLAVLGKLCRGDGVKELRLSSLPWDGELARRLRAGNVRLETTYARSGKAMVRILDLPGVLGKLSGELTRRLRTADAKPWPGRLRIQMPDQSADLLVRGGKVQTVPSEGKAPHAIRGGWEIAQLLIGTDEPTEIAQSYSLSLAGQADRLLGVLFPNQHPFLCRWDSF